MPKQNITINRYLTLEQGQFPEFAWESSIHPADESWILFVPNDRHPDVKPQLWLATGTHTTEDGTIEKVYTPAPGTPCGPCVVPGCDVVVEECELPEGAELAPGEVSLG